MSVMDMNSRMAMAEKLSVQQLQQAIQSGSLPAYIGIPLIEQKNKEKSQMAAAQQGQQKPPSVAAQILQQAEQGVEQLPSNLPVQGMADGGIVAFAEGGDADDFDVEAYREQEAEDEYAGSLSALVAAAQAAAEEGVSTKKKDKKYADGGITRLNDGGAIRFQNRGLVQDDLERMKIEDPEGYARVMREVPGIQNQFQGILPSSDSLEFGEAGSGNVYSPLMRGETGGRASLNYRSQRPRDKVAKGQELPQENLPLSALDFDANPPTLATVPVTSANASLDLKDIPVNTDDMDITRDTSIQGGALPKSGIDKLIAANTANPAVPGAPQNAPQGRTTPTSLVNQTSEQTGRPRSAYDDFLDEIKEGRKDLKTQAEKDKYMAFISAGLGMMSGTSPNALANIGQGAQAGVASYMASGKQRAAEKAALNKAALTGRRYQSMEDIANRTADINEARYAAIAAARGAGGDSKAEALLDKREGAFTGLLRNGELAVKAGLEAKFGDPKVAAMIDKDAYAKEVQRLTKLHINPVVEAQTKFLKKRYPDVYGDQAPPPKADGKLPPLSDPRYNR